MVPHRLAANAAEAARRLSRSSSPHGGGDGVEPLVSLLHTLVEDLGGDRTTTLKATPSDP